MINPHQSEIDEIRKEIIRLSERLTNLEQSIKQDSTNNVGQDKISLGKRNINPKSIPNYTSTVPHPSPNGFTPLKPDLKEQKGSKISFSENLLGTNIMGIVASLLIFIGLVSFVFITLGSASELVQSMVLNVIVLSFFGVGIWMLRHPNALSYSVASCGIGSVFISLLATGLYFQVINQIVLFLLLMIWSGVGWLLSTKYNSNIFFIISSIGFYIALILGLFSDYCINGLFIFILLCIHLVYSIVLMYSGKYSNFIKQIILMCNILFEIFIISRGNLLIGHLTDLSIYPMYILSVLLLVCYGYYRIIKALDISSGMSLNTVYFYIVSLLSCFVIPGAINSIVSHIGTIISEYGLELYQGYHYENVVSVLSILLVIFLSLKYSTISNKFTEYTLVSIMGIIELVYLLNTYYDPIEYALNVLGVLCLSVLFIIFSRMYRSKLYGIVSVVSFNFCWLNIWLGSRLELSETILSVVLVIVVGIFNLYFIYGKSRLLDVLSYMSLIFGITTICGELKYYLNELISWDTSVINITAQDIVSLIVSILIFVIVVFVFYIKSKEQNSSLFKINLSSLDIMGRINYAVSIYLSIAYINNISTNALPIGLFYTLLGFALCLLDVNYCMNKVKISSILLCLKYTFLIELLLHGYLRDVELGYLYSIIGIVIAVLSILCGFVFNHKYFRIYGLVLSLVSVLKLVLIDITYDNSIERVVSFIVGGLLCFGIVCIYNKMSPKVQEKYNRKV